ncbi:MAG: ATP-binding protein, partial [Gammaproteobacteria bacterium]
MQRHSSSALFYFVAAALGVSFSCVLVVLAWNNALKSATRDFTFNTIAVRNEVGANVRTADAIVAGLASFVAAERGQDAQQFQHYIEGTLARYEFISGMAHIRVEPGGARIVQQAGRTRADEVLRLLAVDERARETVDAAVGREAAVPLVPRDGPELQRSLFLVQPLAASGAPDAGYDCAVLTLDLAGLVGAQSVDPSIAIVFYTESEGVAGRQLAYTRAAAGADDASDWVVESLKEDSPVRLNRLSARLVTTRELRWSGIDSGLVLVAAVLGVGVTLLLVALARARDLQARELEARNRVIEEQVRQQTRELAVARDQALEASRVKSDFLASMSHEIRTPLNAIIGMAELLSESRLSHEQENYVGVFRNAGEALLGLVNDILDLSKIEAEQLQLEAIEFDPLAILEQAVDIHALKADGRGVALVIDADAELPAAVRGDPGRLRQVLLNLIGNATKFTAQGAIVVRARGQDVDDATLLRFEIEDSGIGIPADKLESIFGSFTQVDSSITRRYGGTGLGLAICRRLVEMMDGRIWVESVEGQGSVFQFEVRLASVAPAPPPARPRLATDLHLLLVGAEPAGRAALARLLAAWGQHCEQCATVDEAEIRVLAARAAGQPFAAVLVDGQVEPRPGALAGALRARGDATRVVLLFTPSAVAAGVEAVQGLAAVTYLVKPLKRGALLGALDALVEAPTAAPPATVAPSLYRRAARVLLVEDNPDNRLLIKA